MDKKTLKNMLFAAMYGASPQTIAKIAQEETEKAHESGIANSPIEPLWNWKTVFDPRPRWSHFKLDGCGSCKYGGDPEFWKLGLVVNFFHVPCERCVAVCMDRGITMKMYLSNGALVVVRPEIL